jgi:hypothetical protein
MRPGISIEVATVGSTDLIRKSILRQTIRENVLKANIDAASLQRDIR